MAHHEVDLQQILEVVNKIAETIEGINIFIANFIHG